MTRLGAALFLLAATGASPAAPLIDFPTENRALANGRPADFFMYVERDFEGVRTKPWQGGQYGYVRGPSRSGDAVVYNHFHEGIDIKPLQRDAVGNPLDTVKAAADGRVVYANNVSGASNYGRYVVLEHVWGGCPYYTLYAHLNAISVTPEQMVKQGEALGRMGFTGDGIDRERSHVHFEVGLMASRNFDAWHAAHFRDPNKHGLYNGMNIIGMDPAPLLLAARRNPGLAMREYLNGLEPAFKLAIPGSPDFDLLRMYPWLVASGQNANPPAWAVTFSRQGLPLKAEALAAPVAGPAVLWVKDSGESYTRMTRGLVGGVANAPRLTEAGRRLAELLTWPPRPPAAPQ